MAAGRSRRLLADEARARVSTRALLLLLAAMLLALARLGQAFRPPPPHFDHRRPAYAQLVVAQGSSAAPAVMPLPPQSSSSSNQGLMTAMARVLAAPKEQQAQHLDRLLETATAGMGVATGEEWALFALVATRLPPQAKASPGARFLAALGHDLPGRLEMLEPAQLARIVNGWPRGGLDDWERHVIQAIVEACIDRLAAFKPSELAQLVKGLCRPVTATRLEALRGLDRLGEETPDHNARARLLKAGIKVLSRHVTELGPRDLAAFAHACASEMSLQDWCKNLGPAFPRAYTRAVAAHLPALTLQELPAVLSGFLCLRAAFEFTPPHDAGVGVLEALGAAAEARLEEGAAGGRAAGPAAVDVVLPLLVGFAMLGGMDMGDDGLPAAAATEEATPAPRRYDPARVVELLTAQAHGAIEAYPPPAACLVLEALALPGQGYRPSTGVLAAVARRAAAHLWADPMDGLAAAQSAVMVATRGMTAGAEGAVNGVARSVQGFLRLRFGGGGGGRKLL